MASGTLHSSVSAEDPTLQKKVHTGQERDPQFLTERCSCTLQKLQVYFLFFTKSGNEKRKYVKEITVN